MKIKEQNTNHQTQIYLFLEQGSKNQNEKKLGF